MYLDEISKFKETDRETQWRVYIYADVKPQTF
jgi:hypothetical protein